MSRWSVGVLDTRDDDDDQPRSSPAAAVRLFGVYPSLAAARDAVRMLVERGEGGNADDVAAAADVEAFIVDEVQRWIPVRAPDRGSAEDEEEVAAAENEDPSNGRMGSVCDVRRRKGAPPPGGAAGTGACQPTNPVVLSPSPSAPANDAASQRATQQQRQQLDDLLRDGDAAPIETGVQYAAERDRLALLRAFRRKLQHLHADALTKCERAQASIRDLDARHPAHRTAYLAHYRRALRESGILNSAEDPVLLRYLDTDTDGDESGGGETEAVAGGGGNEGGVDLPDGDAR